MMQKNNKTNAMRILDNAEIKYQVRFYEVDENDLSGERVAQQLNLDPSSVFKTLVLKGDRMQYLVACIPVAKTLDLKALAKVSGNKSVEMIQVKDIFALTGYVRGGCCPIGMKKKFATYFDETAICFDELTLSAGQKGVQLVLSPDDIIAITESVLAGLTD